MTNIKNTEERIVSSKISFDQLTELLIDIKHCSSLLSQACDRSLYQCRKMIDEKTEEILE